MILQIWFISWESIFNGRAGAVRFDYFKFWSLVCTCVLYCFRTRILTGQTYEWKFTVLAASATYLIHQQVLATVNIFAQSYNSRAVVEVLSWKSGCFQCRNLTPSCLEMFCLSIVSIHNHLLILFLIHEEHKSQISASQIEN